MTKNARAQIHHGFRHGVPSRGCTPQNVTFYKNFQTSPLNKTSANKLENTSIPHFPLTHHVPRFQTHQNPAKAQEKKEHSTRTCQFPILFGDFVGDTPVPVLPGEFSEWKPEFGLMPAPTPRLEPAKRRSSYEKVFKLPPPPPPFLEGRREEEDAAPGDVRVGDTAGDKGFPKGVFPRLADSTVCGWTRKG